MNKESSVIETTTKAVAKLGPYPTKIGREELWEIIDMWDFSPGNKEKLQAILASDAHIQGPHLFRYYNPKPSRVAAAEEALGELIGVKHCLAVNSCTSALVAAYRALGIGAGDEVIVPAYTFFATAATVVAANAIPVIVEVDDSLNLDPAAVERALTPRTKAIAAVHMRGAPPRWMLCSIWRNGRDCPSWKMWRKPGVALSRAGVSAAWERLGASASIITRWSSAAREAL